MQWKEQISSGRLVYLSKALVLMLYIIFLLTIGKISRHLTEYQKKRRIPLNLQNLRNNCGFFLAERG
jgi:hypothetical protein